VSFDTLAPHYRWMEFLLAGEKLQRCRMRFLSKIDERHNILIPGEGNGRFLLECSRNFPKARITIVDYSAGMLRASRQRAQRNQCDLRNFEFIHQDLRRWKPPAANFDLIVTNFFLDCFDRIELESVIGNLACSANSSATWLLADFQIPTTGLRRARARLVHALMHAFFRPATRISARNLIEPDDLLRKNGFALIERNTSNWDLLRSDYWRATC
jgi:SAM-dependent methyltransferase